LQQQDLQGELRFQLQYPMHQQMQWQVALYHARERNYRP
jgi:hypothetical protein